MKKLLLLIAINTIVNGFLFSQTFEWAVSLGGSNTEDGRSIVTDDLGNVYSTGFFVGIGDFDPGVGTFNLTSNGSHDIYVSKLDPSGNLLWAKNMGGSNSDRGYGIAIDGSGNIYTTGSFSGTADFDPGIGISNLTSAGNTDVFVSKLDGSGNFVWAKRLGGSDTYAGYSISIEASGNILTTGLFSGTGDFDPSAGTYNLTSNGSRDVFVSKLDDLGDFVWAKNLGGSGADDGFSVTTDLSGNVYTTGAFSGTADFDPGAGTSNLMASGTDAFISKLDANGDLVWARNLGGSNAESGFSIVVDGSGNVYSSGIYNGLADFDPGIGTYNLTSNGSADLYISKLDVSGNFVWAKSIGGLGNEQGRSIFLDQAGNVYTTGFYSGTVDFDPGAGTSFLTTAGNYDVFVSKLDDLGNFIWAQSFGGPNFDVAYGLTVDYLGNVYSTGHFFGTADFNPDGGSFELTAAGSDDAFIHKLSQCIPNSGTDVQTACETYDWIDGNTYTSDNNTATWTVMNAAGCDSVVTLDLTITNSNTGTDIQTACNTFDWIDGNTYTSNNNSATWIETNAAGCDSVVTLDLTITNSNTGTDIQTACGTYDWIDGNTYTSNNNTATWIETNAAGCDSIVTLDLTITPLPNNNITQSSSLLTADQVGAAYQWLDCDDNNAQINGETNQTYTPAVTGNYSVEVTLNGCVDTSLCMLVDFTVVNEINNSDINVYPNPTTELLYIELTSNMVGSNYFIYDQLSKVVQNGVINNLSQIINVADLSKGIYNLTIDNSNIHVKIIKE